MIVGSAKATASPTGDAAVALLKSADAKLAGLSSLRATYVEIESYPGKYRDLRQTATVELARPNLVRLQITRARRVTASDPWKDSGNTTLTVSNGQDRYAVFFHAQSTQVRREEARQERVFNEVPILSGFFGGESSPVAEVARAQDRGDLAAISQESPKSVKYRIGDLEKTVTVGDDGLIDHLTVHSLKSDSVQDWSLTSVEQNAALAPDAFRYVPPREAIPYEQTSRRAQPIAVGAEAPDFSVIDQSGKTVHLSDFKGKVVVVKFWATWCWPCNQSMPHTNEVASTSGSDVVVLAVAIHDSKKGFDAWVAKHPQFKAIDFAFQDPTQPGPSDVYHVATTPTEYVIDRTGHVAAVHSGFTGPTDELSDAIKLALQP